MDFEAELVSHRGGYQLVSGSGLEKLEAPVVTDFEAALEAQIELVVLRVSRMGQRGFEIVPGALVHLLAVVELSAALEVAAATAVLRHLAAG